MTTGTAKVNELLPSQLTAPVSYWMSAMTFFASLNFERWVTLISLLLAIGTFCINWYYKHLERRDRLKRYQSERD